LTWMGNGLQGTQKVCLGVHQLPVQGTTESKKDRCNGEKATHLWGPHIITLTATVAKSPIGGKSMIGKITRTGKKGGVRRKGKYNTRTHYPIVGTRYRGIQGYALGCQYTAKGPWALGTGLKVEGRGAILAQGDL